MQEDTGQRPDVRSVPQEREIRELTEIVRRLEQKVRAQEGVNRMLDGKIEDTHTAIDAFVEAAGIEQQDAAAGYAAIGRAKAGGVGGGPSQKPGTTTTEPENRVGEIEKKLVQLDRDIEIEIV